MDMFRFQAEHRKVAYQKGHSFVHQVDKYCAEMDKRLRKLLGGRYERWEKLPDKQQISQDVVL